MTRNNILPDRARQPPQAVVAAVVEIDGDDLAAENFGDAAGSRDFEPIRRAAHFESILIPIASLFPRVGNSATTSRV
jgi:hypothetical protein